MTSLHNDLPFHQDPNTCFMDLSSHSVSCQPVAKESFVTPPTMNRPVNFPPPLHRPGVKNSPRKRVIFFEEDGRGPFMPDFLSEQDMEASANQRPIKLPLRPSMAWNVGCLSSPSRDAGLEKDESTSFIAIGTRFQDSHNNHDESWRSECCNRNSSEGLVSFLGVNKIQHNRSDLVKPVPQKPGLKLHKAPRRKSFGATAA